MENIEKEFGKRVTMNRDKVKTIEEIAASEGEAEEGAVYYLDDLNKRKQLAEKERDELNEKMKKSLTNEEMAKNLLILDNINAEIAQITEKLNKKIKSN